MREVAGHDYDQAMRIAAWPLRELLVAYVAEQRRIVRAAHERAELLTEIRFVMSGKKRPRPPAMPRFVHERDA